MGVADGDQEVDELDQQVIYLPVVDDAPVVCMLLPDKVGLAKSEQASQGLPDVTLPDHDILATGSGLDAHVCTFQAAQGIVRFILHSICPRSMPRLGLVGQCSLSSGPFLASKVYQECVNLP